MSSNGSAPGGRPRNQGLSVSRLAQRDPEHRAVPSVLAEPHPAPSREGASGYAAREPRVPPGWPSAVRPLGTPGWERTAAAWLLDQCPADYRAHPAWQRHPVALAWVAGLHVESQLEAMRAAYRRVRVELAEQLTPEAVEQVKHALETEGLRLRSVQRGISLVGDALRGEVYVPRL